MKSRTILFVHGNFVSKACWDGWVARYAKRGYDCVAVPYPGRDKSVAALKRAHPDPALRKLTLRATLDEYERAIDTLPEKPIIIGHSFGGLITQILINRGLGVAGVAIDSVAPMGVLTLKWSFFRGTFPVLNPFAGSRPYYISFSHWQYAFVNGMPLDQQRAAYDAQAVPESRVLSRGALWLDGRVDFQRQRPPLLIVAGENDRLMPAALNRANFRRYRKSPSITEYKEFPGRNHYTIAAPGWEEVADYALSWAEQKQEAAAAPPLRRAV